MRMTRFIIAIVLASLMLIVKFNFLKLEPAYAVSFVGILDLLSYVALFMGGVVMFVLGKKKVIKKPRTGKEKTRIVIFLLVISLIIISISSYVTLTKGAIEWDAIALYDARAKFLNQGMNFSEMVSLSRFDNKNQYYYLLYPPFTSIVHHLWDQLPVNLPVSFFYSLNLIMIGIGLFVLTKHRLGKLFAIFLVFLSIANRNIFFTSIIEYTNLPFTVYLVFGLFLLFHFLETKEKWYLIFGTLLIGTSQFIRFLEPIWIVIAISFFVSVMIKRRFKANFFPALLLLSFSGLQYYSWQFFVGSIASNPQIFSFSFITLVEGLLGMLTGGLTRVTLYLVVSWGLTLLLHLIALIVVRKRINLASLFLKWVIILSILFYWSSLYLISIEYDWWVEMGESLARSSSYLLPISAYLILYNVKIILGETKADIENRKISLLEVFKRFIK